MPQDKVSSGGVDICEAYRSVLAVLERFKKLAIAKECEGRRVRHEEGIPSIAL
jgi:hypothetical protein